MVGLQTSTNSADAVNADSVTKSGKDQETVQNIASESRKALGSDSNVTNAGAEESRTASTADSYC